MPVRRLWVWHRGGTSVETLLRRYPNLGPARILDALAFAYDNQDLIEADIAREQALFEKQGGPSVGARPLSQLELPFATPAQGEKPSRQLSLLSIDDSKPDTKTPEVKASAPTPKTTRKR